jgi:beta-N-acetylhexosaminidase
LRPDRTRLLRILPHLIAAASVWACASSLPHPEGRISRMTLDEKIGQLFVYPVHGVFMNERSADFLELLRQVRDNHIGGILWFLSDPAETVHLDRQLQEIARVPLLVSADLEAGAGMRFEDTTFWPWPMAVAATGDPSLAEREGEITAIEAKALGINQVYAPVADVNLDPDNPVINVRSFGEDPETVARFSVAFIRGVQKQGVLATAKHFPGHGDTHIDSHRSLPVLKVSRERLERVELVPFRAAIAAGVGSVMVAHLSVPALDPTPAPVRPEGAAENIYTSDLAEITQNAAMPAALSPKIVDGVLRGELGFKGLAVSDALDMGGIIDHFDAGEAAVLAIEAGEDQLPKSANIDAAIAAVKAAVASGRISEARLDRSVRRILEAKARYRAARPDLDALYRILDAPEHEALARQIAQRAVTLVREAPAALPLSSSTKVSILVVDEFVDAVSPAASFVKAVRARTKTPPEIFTLDPKSDAQDEQVFLAGASRAGVVLVALCVRPRSGAGSIAVPERARRAIGQAVGHGAQVIAVSFGSPYLLRDLPELPTYLAAYGVQPVMEQAAAAALFGEAPIGGRLPVTIPGIAARGTGIDRPAAESGAAVARQP